MNSGIFKMIWIPQTSCCWILSLPLVIFYSCPSFIITVFSIQIERFFKIFFFLIVCYNLKYGKGRGKRMCPGKRCFFKKKKTKNNKNKKKLWSQLCVFCRDCRIKAMPLESKGFNLLRLACANWRGNAASLRQRRTRQSVLYTARRPTVVFCLFFQS